MTTTSDDLHDVHPARQLFSLALAILITLPGIVVHVSGLHLAHPLEATLFGLAIVGAAFLLSWAAEVAQLDISAGLAIAVLAFIAVLPEYAVDMVFAWKAGHAVAAYGPDCNAPGAVVASPCSLALANMTGANRLLIGVGWSMVVFIAWYRFRQRGERFTGVELERSHAIELSFLAAATLYSMTLPFKQSIHLYDAVVLVAIFVIYTIRIATAPSEEPHLVGPARYIGTLADGPRRGVVVAMFLFAAAVILLLAESFAEALVATGLALGVSEFLLVQWLAPLASEAPELLVAGLYAWRLNTNAGLGTLVSSKVNQWTLLVGTLPIVFSIASGGMHDLPVDPHQREELLLTASQSVFAVASLVSLTLSIPEAFGLFALFWAQFLLGALVPHQWAGYERIAVSIIYLVLAVFIVRRDRAYLPQLFRDGFRTPHAELHDGD
jgi:cation:H+ antiporter